MYSSEVRVWNEVMGNAPTKEDGADQIIAKAARQSLFVIEEAKEIREAALVGDVQEILDGYLDTKFTNDQIGVYLEAMGVDIHGGWVEVCDSNNTKFSNNRVMMEESKQAYIKEGVEVEVVESPIPGIFVLKRLADGKIMKPLCFREPNLRPFIPKRLRKERV